MHRNILFLAAVILGTGCTRSAPSGPIAIVDLIHEIQDAQQRPSGGVRVAAQSLEGVIRPAIVASVPSRVTWRLPLPRRGILRTFVAVGDAPGDTGSAPLTAGRAVQFRIGISDRRTYETLATMTTNRRGWTEWRIDLSGYAGWQWSVFYRPDRTIWNLILAADAVAATAQPLAVWGAPEILGDVRFAREYIIRRQSLRGSQPPF